MGAPTPLIDGLGCRGGLWSGEKIGIGRFPSLHHRKEGWPSDQENAAKHPLIARPGWFSDENKRKTTPAASVSVAARNFIDDAATPPCGDARRGITLDSNSFTAPMNAVLFTDPGPAYCSPLAPYTTPALRTILPLTIVRTERICLISWS